MNIKSNTGESVSSTRCAYCSPTNNREFYEALENSTLSTNSHRYDVEFVRDSDGIKVVCRHRGHFPERFTIEITGQEICALLYYLKTGREPLLGGADEEREGTISMLKMSTAFHNAVGHELYAEYSEAQRKLYEEQEKKEEMTTLSGSELAVQGEGT